MDTEWWRERRLDEKIIMEEELLQETNTLDKPSLQHIQTVCLYLQRH
jgi:hypothetical protein